MTLQVALSAPTPICPDPGAIYQLEARPYRLMNGAGRFLVAHLVNFGTSPATVAGSIASTTGALVIAERAAVMVGWDVAGTTWHALRMCETVAATKPEDLPPGGEFHSVRFPGLLSGPAAGRQDVRVVPADAPFLVEALNGTTARIPLSAIEEYLAGRLLALPGVQSSPVWGAPK